MSEAKHTPGPWEWVSGKRSWQGCFEPDICDFGDDTTYYPTEGSPPNEANARLIAAAPDLLDALERIVALCDACPGVADGAAEIARPAIAKAKGKT